MKCELKYVLKYVALTLWLCLWAPLWAQTPAQPSLTATPGEAKVTLAWPVVPGATYTLERAMSPAGPYAPLVSGLTSPSYVDQAVVNGTVYYYRIISASVSVPVSATPFAPRPPPTLPAISNITLTGGDDSALVEFDSVASAKDYRVYELGMPHRMKYAGYTPPPYYPTDPAFGPDPTHTTPARYSVQWNGIDPAKGATLIIEAVDANGPFMDPVGMLTCPPDCECGQQPDCPCCLHVHNGHGDPANKPVAIARGQITVKPSDLKALAAPVGAEQVFIETWRDSKPFVPTGINPKLPGSHAQQYGEYREFSNTRWKASEWLTDRTAGKTAVFVADGHLMTVNADNKAVTDSTWVLEPSATFDISGGKTLHVEWEVDAHSTSRRFTSMSIVRADAQIVDPAETWRPPVATSGRTLTWTIEQETNKLWYGDQGLTTPTPISQGWADYWPGNARKYWDHRGPMANGTALDIDKRHRFVMEVTNTSPTATRVKIEEFDARGTRLCVLDKTTTALGYDRLRIFFSSQLYHSSLEHQEISTSAPRFNPYLWLRMPNRDERHWDSTLVYVIKR
jgi:hypothetical protein